MSNVAGIKFIQDAKQNNRYVTIDLKKHGKTINPILTKLGAIKKTKVKNEEFVTPEELRNNLHKRVKELWKK